MTVQTPLVTPDFALDDTIVVSPASSSAASTRPIAATLGGFTSASRAGCSAALLPTEKSQYLPSFLFAAVIVVLLVKPNGTVRPAAGAVERV